MLDSAHTEFTLSPRSSTHLASYVLVGGITQLNLTLLIFDTAFVESFLSAQSPARCDFATLLLDLVHVASTPFLRSFVCLDFASLVLEIAALGLLSPLQSLA